MGYRESAANAIRRADEPVQLPDRATRGILTRREELDELAGGRRVAVAWQLVLASADADGLRAGNTVIARNTEFRVAVLVVNAATAEITLNERRPSPAKGS